MPPGTCKRCSEPTGNPDGRQWYCEPCRLAKLAEKRSTDRTLALQIGSRRKPCARCGDPKGPGQREWYCEVCKPIVAAEVREGYRQRAAAWYAENHDAALDRSATQRARKAGATIVEHVDRLIVLELADGVCGICGEDVDPFSYDTDHIVPLSRGGEHSYANVQAAHPRCNSLKWATMPQEGVY